MDIVRDIIEASARARDVARYKLRWPVNDITIVSNNEKVFDAVKHLENVIKDQSNTKNIITSKEFKNLKFIPKPNLKTLGPKLRQDMGLVKKFLEESDGNKIKSDLEDNGNIEIKITDQNNEEKLIELSCEDILFDRELPSDIVSAEFDEGTVFVNTQITPEIFSESMSRELIRRIQDMRKDMDLDVEANIDVTVQSSNEFENLFSNQINLIVNEIRANNLLFDNIDDNIKNKDLKNNVYIKDWKIEDEDIKILIKS